MGSATPTTLDSQRQIQDSPASELHHQVVIIGAGTAGTSVAASLLRQRPELDIAVVEPSNLHYYQPALTLVGAGTYAPDKTVREQRELLPPRVTWIRQAARTFRPEQRQLVLKNGQVLQYEQLVVCPGIQLDWDGIEGLPETLGQNGVCSNYSPAVAPYTWECLQAFRGGRALFTQPPAPIKCAGAPQKIAYLAADHARRTGVLANSDFQFFTAGPSVFSVADFVPHLEAVARNHEIGLNYGRNLVSVDGPNKIARFQVTDALGQPRLVEEAFDLLHVTPPQSAPRFVRESPLANASGWVDVDPHTLVHVTYDNVFALGDASSLPTSKTAAAIRKQSPVVVKNLLAHRDGRDPVAGYDGYTSCPLVTGYGKVMLAEFIYGGTVTPTLPLNPFQESRFYWFVKKYLLPRFYWSLMLRGFERDIAHKPRSFS